MGPEHSGINSPAGGLGAQKPSASQPQQIRLIVDSRRGKKKQNKQGEGKHARHRLHQCGRGCEVGKQLLASWESTSQRSHSSHLGLFPPPVYDGNAELVRLLGCGGHRENKRGSARFSLTSAKDERKASQVVAPPKKERGATPCRRRVIKNSPPPPAKSQLRA